MTLAEVLASKSVDKGLDDIFKSSAGPSSIASAKRVQTNPAPHKRKSEDTSKAQTSKRPRASVDLRAKPVDVHREKERDSKGKVKQGEFDEEDGQEEEKDDATSDEDEASSIVPEHESVKKPRREKKGLKKAKYSPEGETREQRDTRTIFIGNLPVSVVKSKPLMKQLKRHILSHVPSAKIESIRFRSIAFGNPTSALEDEDDEKSSKHNRQQKRTAEWRAQHTSTDQTSKRDEEEAEEDKKGEKKYMTPAEKRRLAAIKGELHDHSSATTNAYIVFAHPAPLPADAQVVHAPRKEVMDPFEAAREAIRKANGSYFADHMLRVDLVRKPLEAARDLDIATGAMTDPRLSIFVGNLDFASSEDDVRAFFEKVMCEERGNADAAVSENDNEASEEELASPKRPAWVTRVRIVRDRETRVGKGFAYVQFADRDCVDEVLALEGEKLKFAKRILRVQRCKVVSDTTTKSPKLVQRAVKVASAVAPKQRVQAAPVSLPKGDPMLGKRLVGLPKEERKKAKAADSVRVARRLAKKKARMGLEDTEEAKKRARERKNKNSKGVVNTGRKEKKKRERSERNLQRKNVKK